MMITGSEKESRTLMMNAAVEIVAEYGFEGFTTKKWAAAAGVAEGSLYYHFKSKNDLLEETFVAIDHEMTELLKEVRRQYRGIRTVGDVQTFLTAAWKAYYEYLIKNRKRTIFYYRFRTSPRYNDVIQKEQFAHFEGFIESMKEIRDVVHFREHPNWGIVWTYLMDTTVAFVFRILTGGLEGSDENIRQMAGLFTTGLYGFFYPERICLT